MKKSLFQSSIVLLLLGLMSTGHATPNQYVPVYCDQGHSLQNAIDRATEGAWIDVWGTCNESVVIRTDGLRIGTFEGQTATINATGITAIAVAGARNVFIFRLNIIGGIQGVAVNGGGSAEVRDNQINGATADGIIVGSGNSFAVINNNVLNNRILVLNGSAAEVYANTITASTTSGIIVTGASHITLCGNVISNTSQSGILIGTNSNIQFAGEFFCGPNTVNNAGAEAFRCSQSGSAEVQLDQVLNGAKFYEPGCHMTRAPGVSTP